MSRSAGDQSGAATETAYVLFLLMLWTAVCGFRVPE